LKKHPNLVVMLETEIRDKNGKLISKHIQPSKSLLKNFAILLRLMMSAYSVTGSVYTITTSIIDINNTTKTVAGAFVAGAANGGLVPLMVNAPAGVDDCGIVVGTGTGVVTRDNIALGSKISHGTNAGQLAYGSNSVEDVSGTDPESVWRVVRTFSNGTSSSITVYEIGMYAKNNYGSGGSFTLVTFCIARDVLSTPQTIPAGATLTVRYVFKVTA